MNANKIKWHVCTRLDVDENQIIRSNLKGFPFDQENQNHKSFFYVQKQILKK